MYRSSVVTAAFAAGVMAFAIGTAQSAPLSPRAVEGTVPVRSAPAAKVEKATASVKTKKRHVRKSPARKHVAKKSKPRIDMTSTASISREGRTVPAAGTASAQYSGIIARYAADYGVPVSLAHAVIRIESNYRPNLTGSAGEVGLMQIKPSTARMMGYEGSVKALYHPENNIKYGMKYLAMARNLGGGTTCGTILKYNAGHAATRMNPVSSAYCQKVKVQLAALGSPV